MSAAEIVNKVWNYAHVLRALQNPFGFHQVFPELRSGHDGVGYGDYVEQITYLIFLTYLPIRRRQEMANEREVAGQQVQVPNKYTWSKLVKLDGDLSACDAQAGDLELQYRHTLESLGKQGGTCLPDRRRHVLGTIFRKAQNKIQDPAKLERLIKMIVKEQWSTLPADVKGAIYEGLLEAAPAMAQASFSTYRSHLLPGSRGTRTSMFIAHAQDVKGGAGQYSARASCFALTPASMQSFTPRPLIQAMVEVMQPKPTDTVADPACGTGGFLLAAHDYMAAQATSKKEQRHLKEHALRGNDIVDRVVCLCVIFRKRNYIQRLIIRMLCEYLRFKYTRQIRVSKCVQMSVAYDH